MSLIQGSTYLAVYTAGTVLDSATVVLTVTAPDLSTSFPVVTVLQSNASATIPALQVGSYLLVWSISGTVVDAQQDQFTVVAPGLDLVDLADIRDALNISPADRTKDAKLRRWSKAATFVVENITGPILPKSRVSLFDGGNSYVILPYRWVKSITSVVETRGVTNYTLTNQPLGFAVDGFGYTWDTDTNKIIRRAMNAESVFPPGPNQIAVTYVIGMTSIPEDIQQAAAELVKHWYRQSEVPFRAGFSAQASDDVGMQMVGNYLVPNAVMELLDPWRRHPGFF